MSDPTVEGMSPEARRAYIRFKTAFAHFADEPSPPNLSRYLAASRALEFARRADSAAGTRAESAGEPPSAA